MVTSCARTRAPARERSRGRAGRATDLAGGWEKPPREDDTAMSRKKSAQRPRSATRAFPYALILAIVAAAVFANTLRNGFTLDDRTLLEEDPRIASLARVPEILAGGYRYGPLNSLYRPVTVLSFALNRAVTGPAPWGFHLVNVLLHVAATILVFRVGSVLLGNRAVAFTAGLLFALHPIHTEAVANVVGRAEILVAIGVLGALAVLLRDGPMTAQRGAAAAALFALALLSKENAVALVPIWAMVLFFRAPGPFGARLRAVAADYRLWGFVLVTLGYLALRRAVLGTIAPAVQPEITFVENPLAFVPGSTRILTAVKVLARYLGLLVLPFPLSADYSYDEIPLVRTPLDRSFLVAAATLAAVAGAALAFARRQPIYVLAFGIVLAALLPVANLVIPIGTIMAERLLYLPSVGAVWAMASLLQALGWIPANDQQFPRLRLDKGTAVILIAIVIPWTAKTVMRNAEWRDNLRLFESARHAAPRSAKVRTQLGDSYFAVSDYTSAVAAYRAALRIYPDYAGAAINLGSAYDALGRYDETLDLLGSFAGRSGPFETARLRELARALIGKRNYPAAAETYEAVLRAAEGDALAHRNLGAVYLEHLGRPEEGKRHLRRSLELAPDQPGAAEMRTALGK
jgi:tetratricopeptide (TPR) repeat protein